MPYLNVVAILYISVLNAPPMWVMPALYGMTGPVINALPILQINGVNGVNDRPVVVMMG